MLFKIAETTLIAKVATHYNSIIIVIMSRHLG